MMHIPVLVFVGNVAWLFGWTLLLQEGAARSGAGLLPLLRRRPFGPLGRAGAGSLLGWCMYSSTLLGLAALGLFRPGPIVGSAVACVLGSRAALARRPLWWNAAQAARSLPLPGLAVFGVGLSPLLVAAMTTGMDQDSFVYHLGVAWQWLQAGRLFSGDVQLGMHVPLLADLANVLPILLDDQRLAKCLVVASMVCGSACWADRCRERGQPGAAWIGPLLAISAGSMFMLLTTGKNDVAACMLFLVGACLTLDGAWVAGAAFLGMALAAKFVYGPQIIFWLLLIRPPRRLWIPAAVLLVLPSLPWWIRTWIATGNPLFPFGAGVFGQFDWSPANQQVFDYYQRSLWEPGTWQWRDVVPKGWCRSVWLGHPLVLMALPVLLWSTRTRVPTLACVAGGMVTLAMGHQVRYIMPSIVLLSCLIAAEAARLFARWNPAGTALLAGYALLRIALSPILRDIEWNDSWRPLTRARTERLGTYWEATQYLQGLHPARVISTGDPRLYLLPGRALYGGYFGETPLLWKITKASADVEDVHRKFRQLGAQFLLHNFVSVESTEVPYLPFTWTDRDLRIYVDFCKRYLVPVWHTTTADHVNGGFYVLAVRSRPLPHPPTVTWFAPGTEWVYGPGTAHRIAGRLPEALTGYLDGWKRLPDVGSSWSRVGHAYAALGDMPRTHHFLSRFADQGMMDSMNLPEYAASLVNTGRTANTEQVLEDAWNKYPDHRTMIRINQAGYFGQQALNAINALQHEAAIGLLDRADALLAQIPPGSNPGREPGRRKSAAYLLGLRGEAWLARGNRVQAVKYFRDSIQMDDGTPLSTRWRQLAAQSSNRMF